MTNPYGELHAHSAFSFLDGASQPEELIAEAARLGLSSIALTDHNGLYGVVRFAQAAKEVGMATSFGAELHLPTATGELQAPTAGPDPVADHLVVLARGPAGYHNLSSAIAGAHLASGTKGLARYNLADLADHAQNQWLVLTGCRKGKVRKALPDTDAATSEVRLLQEAFGKDNVAVEITGTGDPYDHERNEQLATVANRTGAHLVATTNAHYANPRSAPLAQALAAIRSAKNLNQMQGWLNPSGAQHLRSGAEMMQLHRAHPGAVTRAHELGQDCAFDLALVAPNLPPFAVPRGHTEASWLRHLVAQGAARRYGTRNTERVPGAYRQLAHELDVIETLNFPGYFLIVYDIMEFCRTNNILAQGRGSAANSAVCYALGITAVDAVSHGLLFERFLAPERDGPPDIDVDIESARREEVIQYVYTRYGRHHAAQVANVISYRSRSAVRDAARALGFDVGQQDAWSKGIDRWGSLLRDEAAGASAGNGGSASADSADVDATARRDGFSPTAQELQRFPNDNIADVPNAVIELAEQLRRLPRHLGIHSGGMVLCDRPVTQVCPVEWARKEGRTVLQWDKEDCADAGLVKFDLLGLGMLTALRLAFDLIATHEGQRWELHGLPQDDPAVYRLLCAADTVGVFQVESRAQIATLPRLRPKEFYDIVVAVALIRPGPIQGNSVHPYINRRRKREKITYAHPLLENSLGKTLGVPLFQEQLMQMAIDTANFTPAEADQLRRAMGSKRSVERMEALRLRLLTGMGANGIDPATAEGIYNKLKAFSDFGFPESHAYSFAYLVYASSWLKVHHPAAFYAGLLGAQPMGFYSPQSLMNDARRHGLKVLGPCIQNSAALADITSAHNVPDIAWPVIKARIPVPTHLAIRMGLMSVRTIGQPEADRIIAARTAANFTDLRDFARRTELTKPQLEALATAGALAVLGVTRREGLWAAGALTQEQPGTLPGLSVGVESPQLPLMSAVETAQADQWASGITPDSYPTEFIRPQLQAAGILSAEQVNNWEPERRIATAGVVTHRQRPGTAAGVTFLSLEDETGIVNVVCSVGAWNKFGRIVRTAPALIIRGRVEHADGATNLVAEHFAPLSLHVKTSSRDFQ